MTAADFDVIAERLKGLERLIEARFKSLEQRLDTLAEMRKQLDDHEDRIVRLERWPWLIAGVAAFLSPVIIWAIIEIIKALV